jgi:hypothetical protein
MTSSSVYGRRVAALLLVLAAGCANDRVVETQVIVLAETELCDLATTAVVRDMDMRFAVNAYRVALFEFTPEGPVDPLSCRTCIAEGRCPRIEESCLCDQPRPPRALDLNNALAGLRFESLDPDIRYCFLLQGFGMFPPPDPCTCDALDVENTRLCGASFLPGGVEENSTATLIPVECRRCPFLEGR